MKKKIFTLLTLLLSFVTGVQAQTEVVMFDGTSESATVPGTTEQTDATTGFKYTFATFKSSMTDVSGYTGNGDITTGTYKRAIRYHGGTAGATNGITLKVPEGYTASIYVIYGVTEATNYFGLSSNNTKPNGSGCTTWNATVSSASNLYSATISNLTEGTYYLGGSKDKCVIAYLKATLISTTAAVAPSNPTFSPDGGAVVGFSSVTISSTNAQMIYYCWSDNDTAPDQGDALYTASVGSSFVFNIPNVDGTKYLHAYGWNNYNTNSYTVTLTKTYNVTAKEADYTFTPIYEDGGVIDDGTVVTTSTGGKMVVSTSGTKTVMSYATVNNNKYIQFGFDKNAEGGAGGVTITLNKKMQVGTIITGILYFNAQNANRGVNLCNSSGTSKAEWKFDAPEGGGSETFIYTVSAGDGLEGSNIFKLHRLNNVYLTSLTVANCSDEYAITPANAKSTYVTPAALDFSGVDGLTAYVATGKGDDKVIMTKVDAVPAETPLMLVGTAGSTYYVPVAVSATAPTTNYLVASTGDGVTFDGTETNQYILYTDGLFHLPGTGTLAAGKAYLDLDGVMASRVLSISFSDEETTGIEAVNVNTESNNAAREYYNLNGQRVANPTKGLYIVNGKKVIIK